MLENFHIVAFTHREVAVNEIGVLHIADDNRDLRLNQLKSALELSELMFLSTCNRVEFLFCTHENVDDSYLKSFFAVLYPEMDEVNLKFCLKKSEKYQGIHAVEHILSVASSIDSMVIGEREIISQVRQSFENCKKANLTGDFIRLVMRHTIETAKLVYTNTSIATKPVSVVSLAYHKLKDLQIPLNARVLIVGSGVTNTNMSRFLKKHGFKNFAVFNRTLSNAEKLAHELHASFQTLEQLNYYDKGFDVLITCTGSENHILTPDLYKHLLQGETTKKVVIDLAIPQDIDPEILKKHHLNYISVDLLQKISNENLKERSKEIQHVEEIIREALFEFEHIHKIRKVELAMRDVPQKVKEIKSIAINEVFKHDIASLDENSKEVLDRVLSYMEKKYMSVPMIMAKEILINN